jgi:hypothetical protein
MVGSPIVRRSIWLLFLVGLVLVSPTYLFAQDSHYWTNQFGNARAFSEAPSWAARAT